MRTRQVIEQLLQKFKVTICVVAQARAAMFRNVKSTVSYQCWVKGRK